MGRTIKDFWRMIWEHKPTTIVMLTKQIEGGKVHTHTHTHTDCDFDIAMLRDECMCGIMV